MSHEFRLTEPGLQPLGCFGNRGLKGQFFPIMKKIAVLPVGLNAETCIRFIAHHAANGAVFRILNLHTNSLPGDSIVPSSLPLWHNNGGDAFKKAGFPELHDVFVHAAGIPEFLSRLPGGKAGDIGRADIAFTGDRNVPEHRGLAGINVQNGIQRFLFSIDIIMLFEQPGIGESLFVHAFHEVTDTAKHLGSGSRLSLFKPGNSGSGEHSPGPVRELPGDPRTSAVQRGDVSDGVAGTRDKREGDTGLPRFLPRYGKFCPAIVKPFGAHELPGCFDVLTRSPLKSEASVRRPLLQALQLAGVLHASRQIPAAGFHSVFIPDIKVNRIGQRIFRHNILWDILFFLRLFPAAGESAAAD